MSIAQRAGLAAAVVLAALLAVTALASIGHERLVVPTNGVTAGGAKDNPAGLGSLPDLQARTRLQRWSNDAPGADVEAGEAPSLSIGAPPPQGAELAQRWLAARDANKDILKEERLWSGRSSLPGAEHGVLVQPQGRIWRRLHNDQLAYGGGFYIFGISLLLAAFLAWRGRVPLDEPESGQTVQRFTALERANHWLTAASFILMALTGLVILYGDALIRPWLGADPYASLARVSAWLHMTFAVPFVIGVVVMIALWTRQNLPERLDWVWLKRAGGFLPGQEDHPPARKFNAGQKIVFWGVAVGGLILTATGIGLMFPFQWSGYTGMQVAQIAHAAVALLMIGLIIGHIYIGTVGMVGAFDAMWSGRVDRTWAKEHHSLWHPSASGAGERSDGDTGPVLARRSAWASLGTGVAVAAIFAIATLGIYQLTSMSSAERGQTSAVHVESR